MRSALVLAVAVVAAATGVIGLAPGSAAAAPAVPEALAVGTRLTWQAGDASTEGARLVPDANGWIWSNEQWNRLESSGGSGGVGIQQLDIVASSTSQVIGDLRTYVNTDLQTGVTVSSGASMVAGDVSEIPGFWMAPSRLAALTVGFDGTTRVTRGLRTFNGQTFDTVSIAHVGAGTYDSSSYDTATGVLLFGGSMVTSAAVTITDQNGNLPETFQGSVRTQHALFVGMRQVVTPWADATTPAWLRPGLSLTYTGQTSMGSAPQTGLPGLAGQQVEAIQTIDQVSGGVAQARQTLRFSNGAGLPPTESTTSRVYASSVLDGLWIPADRIATIAEGTVLDEDPLTGRTVTFGGVQGTMAVIVNSGPSDQVEQYYDTQTGMLVATRSAVTTGAVGTQITELSLVSS